MDILMAIRLNIGLSVITVNEFETVHHVVKFVVDVQIEIEFLLLELHFAVLPVILHFVNFVFIDRVYHSKFTYCKYFFRTQGVEFVVGLLFVQPEILDFGRVGSVQKIQFEFFVVELVLERIFDAHYVRQLFWLV